MRARWMLVATTLTALLLSGCVPDPVSIPAEPTPSAAPVFASEEEALAAAVEAYEAYLAVSDQIAADGGANPERLKDLVTPEWYEKELEVIGLVRAAGIRQVGDSSSRNAALQQFSSTSISIYICADSSNTSFVDSEGIDVTSSSRLTLVTNEVVFDAHDGELLLARSEPWNEASLCE